MEAKINAGNTTAVTVHKELYIQKVQTCDHHKALTIEQPQECIF